MPRAALIIFALFCIASPGCVTTLTPPADVRDPATVYVTDYGRHASLLLPRQGGYTEYAYGEWGWFAQGKTGVLRGPLVLMVPGQATLGRRTLGPIADTLEASVKADGAAAAPFQVERDRVDRLLADLDARFEAHAESRIEGPGGMEFVKDPRPYYALHNSNGVTAEWIRELGVGVEGPALLSKFKVAAPAHAMKQEQSSHR